jgi:hypothetical protein
MSAVAPRQAGNEVEGRCCTSHRRPTTQQLRPYATVRVADDDVYVRSYCGGGGAWFRDALQRRESSIRAGGPGTQRSVRRIRGQRPPRDRPRLPDEVSRSQRRVRPPTPPLVSRADPDELIAGPSGCVHCFQVGAGRDFSQQTRFRRQLGVSALRGTGRVFHQLVGLSAVVTRHATPPTARRARDRFRLPRRQMVGGPLAACARGAMRSRAGAAEARVGWG